MKRIAILMRWCIYYVINPFINSKLVDEDFAIERFINHTNYETK